jgi:dihydropteroate synthase
MGVLNVTPDSFSDGGRYLDADAAITHAIEMERRGADIIDVGAESTRPGSKGINENEEMSRLLPVLEGLRGKLRIPISVDTQKAGVAQAALAAGAEIVNDVSALRADPEIAVVVRRFRAGIVLMHMRGKPRTMQQGPFARDVMRDVAAGLRAAVVRAHKAGIEKSRILIDPGLGFGKRYTQNLKLLARLPELATLGYPLVVGPSRKAFIGWVLACGDQPRPPQERLWGTAATVASAILGGAHIVRVHDVCEMADVARVAEAIARAGV